MTPPRTKKLFISYRSSDAAKVDGIAQDLALLQYDDGTPRYITWQDKHNLPPASPHWWDAIVDAIVDCHVFVFHLSLASLQSEVCRAELEYAHKRNRVIIPVVLEGEFLLNPSSGKHDLPDATWSLVPDWLRERQFLFCTGTEFYSGFEKAVALFERNWPRDISAPRPLNPDSKSVHGSNHALYEAACDYSERLAFADAEKHFDALVRRNDADYADAAAQWLEVIRLYAELIEIVQRRSAEFVFRKKLATYEALFPKEYMEGVFDPKGLLTRNSLATPTSAVKSVEAPSLDTTQTRSIGLLPPPFSWVDFPKEGYSIAKYPLTNGQYRLFVEAGGYREKRWWTYAGWQAREASEWIEPRYWQDDEWTQPDHPVVGVSWYEAVAYCLWLSEVTDESVMLPTEEQWQYAAQGGDGRNYPWGKKWDSSRCNNNVAGKGTGMTTPVGLYEGRGDSPFGVVDMAGNVWEWCLTDYDNETDDVNGVAQSRVLRGGSWFSKNSDGFCCDFRGRSDPGIRSNFRGFRIALSSLF